MPKPSLLPLTAFELALLQRIHDNPGTYSRALCNMFDPPLTESRVSQITKRLWEVHHHIRRGKPYRAQPTGGSPRIPLYITDKGKAALNEHARVIFGIKEVV